MAEGPQQERRGHGIAETPRILIGAHVPVAGGYENGLEYAREVGAECAQIFAKSPRQWAGPATDPAAVKRFAADSAGFGPVFTHAAYLLNLASVDDVLWNRSVDALTDELHRGFGLGAAGVVTHVGSDKSGDPDQAAARVARAVDLAYERLEADHASDVRLLLENTAGAGSSFGSTFAQLGDVISRTGLPPSRLGVCLDTCHAHAFGMVLDSRQGWGELIESLSADVGLERLGLIHANDSMFAAASHRDRHAWIGDGTIGYEGFSAMFDALLPVLDRELCAITEMSGERPHKDEENLRRLRELRTVALGQ